MESTEQKGLANLPIRVFTKGLLPLLSVNEVLRLRRVCTTLKSICDDHLKTTCPSKNIVRLRRYERKHQSYEDSLLEEFLKFDSTSSIRIPSQHFVLNFSFGIGFGVSSLNLSTIYGPQMKHLSLDRMRLPFVANSAEFFFFENLPNLSSLTLNVVKQNGANDADREMAPESLPTCFKNSIKKFAVTDLFLDRESDADKFWEMVGLFEKLECFQLPKYCTRHYSPSRILEKCCKLIGTESSNITCLDLHNLEPECLAGPRSEESLKLFSQQSLGYNIKWKNVPGWIFWKRLYKTTWTLNADLIVSMSDFFFPNLKGLSFPHLVSLEVTRISSGLPRNLRLSDFKLIKDWSTIPQILSPSIYPALRILKVTEVDTDDNKYFSKAWPYLTNLEEVSFQLEERAMNLSSEAFLGQDETREPPFLRLIRLKKLSFHIPLTISDPGSPPHYCRIGEAFHKAFRLMPLKEFKITSDMAIKSGTFDKDAILALCSPGPFIQNIEKFSFRNWTMEGLTVEEFRQLERLFPNNQAL